MQCRFQKALPDHPKKPAGFPFCLIQKNIKHRASLLFIATIAAQKLYFGTQYNLFFPK
jgi:hypothetical protein